MSSPTHTFTKPNRPLTWLITGSSSGFGLVLARLAQSHGHRVIATSRNPSRTPDLVREIEGRGGTWLQLDVCDPSAGAQILAAQEAAGTPVDVLVNGAGASVHNAAEALTEDEVRAQMELLYFGPVRLMRAAVPGMRRRRYGVVVNISSAAGLRGRESMAAYASGKAALDGYTKILASEVAAFNVRALYVSMGSFETNMVASAQRGTVPLDPDYKGTLVEAITNALGDGTFVPDGDTQKAVQAIYEVIMGEGVGKGLEAETVLPLGRDAAKRIQEIADQWTRTMQVFGEVCNNVYLEKKETA